MTIKEIVHASPDPDSKHTVKVELPDRFTVVSKQALTTIKHKLMQIYYINEDQDLDNRIEYCVNEIDRMLHIDPPTFQGEQK